MVEEPADLLAIERVREFRGRYHVLHGTLAPLDGVGPDDLKIQPLLVRLHDDPVREVILATNPDGRGRGDRALPGEAAEAARHPGHAHRARRCRSAATSSTPTS